MFYGCLPCRTVSVRSSFKAAAALRSANSLRPIPSSLRVSPWWKKRYRRQRSSRRESYICVKKQPGPYRYSEPMSELSSMIERIEDPLSVIDMIASTLHLASAERQEILAIFDPEARAQRVSEHLACPIHFEVL